MSRGVDYDTAHAAALARYGVSEYSVYHPSVIRRYPAEFNTALLTGPSTEMSHDELVALIKRVCGRGS